MSLVLPGLLVAAALGWLVLRTSPKRETPPPVRNAGEEVAAAGRAPDAGPAPAGDVSRPTAAPARDPAIGERLRQRREEREVERRAKAEPAWTLNAPGEQKGLAAFPAPGTKPIKHGIVVPDDFELPPGYIRHYQTTDDGRRLPPILMFHPDFAGTDANGNPVVVPEDRVVPPELSPPGLPKRMLDETTDVDARVGRQVHAATEPPAGRR
jgi:hypothetical protein